MQWPPRPGPGLNGMKPNGFVAAASMTSQTSIPIRSQSCASSLTSAMLTERKMFSSSFVSSAASAVETSWTSSSALRRARRPPSVRRGVDAADDLRRRLRRPVGRGPGRRARARTRGRSPCRPSARCPLRGSAAARRASSRDTSSTRGRRGGPCCRCGAIVACGAQDVAEVRLALRGERRRQRDHDRVAVARRCRSRSSRRSAPASTSRRSSSDGTSSMWLSPRLIPSTTRLLDVDEDDAPARPRRRSERAASPT